MNRKIIVPCAIISIVALTLILNIDYEGYANKTLDNLPEIQKMAIPGLYDCAKNVDKLMSYSEKLQEGQKTANPYKEATDLYYAITSQGVETIENRCWITIESWAHESQYEAAIWSMDWQKMSWNNQVVLNETDCETKQCNDMKNAYANKKSEKK